MDNFKVADGRAEFEIQVRAGQPPQAEPGGISEDKASDGSFTSLGNIGRLVGVYIHFDKAAFSGALSIFKTACTRTSLGVFSSWNTTDANHFENVTNTTHINGLTAPASTAFLPEALILANRFPGPSEDFLPVFRWSCPVTASNNDGPARLALEGRSFSQAEQLTGAGSQSETYSMVADNNLWYYPLDSTPSIVNAELGNAQLADGFYIDLWFSEGVYGAPSGATTITPVTAGAFNFLQAQDVSYPAKSPVSDPTVNDTRAMAAPSKVSKPDGGVLAGGETVIRLHYPSDQHPGALFGASELTEEFTIGIQPPASGKTIVDADGNELHGGTDWHMQVFYDRFAPHINRATVGPRSRYIDVTLNKNAKFGIRYNNDDKSTPVITNVAPSPADFVIIHYDSSESTERRLSPSAIQTHDGEDMSGRTFDEGLQALRLVMPDGDYDSSDRVDIRIAEQVKELRYPSLGSVFDVSQKKGTSQFPRTAAPAQVGGLQLRGRERYSIAFTQVLTDQANNLGLITATTLPDSPIENPNIVDEGNDADEGTLWGVLISRPESDAGDVSTIRLSLLREVGPADNSGVSWGHKALGATAFSEVSVDIPEDLIFAAGESAKLFVIRLAENTDTGTGNRRYKIEISVTDTDAQAIEGAASVTVGTNEDDDVPAFLSVLPNPDDGDFTESNLQTQMSGVSIVHPSTAIHQIVDINPPGITDDRFRQFIIEMVFENGGVPQSLTDNLLIKESRVVDFVPLEPSGQQVSIGRGSEERSLGANVRDGRLEFDADPSGGIDASWFKTLLTERLRFKLADGQNDPGETVRFIFTATPAERSPNQTPAETSVTYTITPQNDLPTGVAQDIPAVNEAASDDIGQTVTVVNNLSAVESGQVISSVTLNEVGVQVNNPGVSNATAELFSVNPAVSLSGGDSVELVYAPRAYRHGTLTFSVQVGDSDGATADFGPFTITINPVDNEPEITAPVAVTYDEYDEGAARLIELSDISNGPDEQPVSADHPVVMSASFDGFLDQDGVEFNVGGQDLRVADSSVPVTQVTTSMDITGLPNSNGAATITFTATDGTADSGIAGGDTGLSATREVLAIINPVNDAPVLAQAPGAPFSVAPGEATTLKATITDPDIQARLAGFSPGSSELGYRAGSALTVALDEGSRNAEVDSKAVNIRLVDALKADGGRLEVGGVELTVFRFVSADDLTIIAGSGSTDFGQIKVTRSTPPAVTTGDNRQILRADVVTSNLRQEAMNAFLQAAIMISIDDTDTSIRQDRVVEISFWDQGNDGEGGDAGPPMPSNQLAFALTSDPAPVITFGAAVTLTEDELKQPQVIFANTTITDVNEDTSLDPGTASGGSHGAAIASIQVVASAGANGALPDPTWVTDALPSGFSAAPNGLAVALTPTGASTLTSTGGAQAALRALSFRIADDNQDPPETITFEVTLRPVQDVAGINPTNAVGTYTVEVTDINDRPTVELDIDTVSQDEDDPSGLANTVITIGSADAIETGQALQQGAATLVAASLTSTPNNVDGRLESLFTTSPSVNVSRTEIQVTHGTPAPGKYGIVEYSFTVQDAGGGDSDTSEPFSFTYQVRPVADPIVVTVSVPRAPDPEGTTQSLQSTASLTVADGPEENDDISVSVTGFELWRNGDRGRSISGADAFAQLANFRMSVGVSGGSTREEALTGVGGDGFEVPSGATLGLLGDLKDGLENFNGIGELRVALVDVPGQDGIQGPGTERSFFLSIAARDDPLELDLPEFLMVNVGTSETFIRGVSDPDVDPIALVGAGGGELAGNNAPYLRAGDTLIVKISAPGNASEADKMSVGVADNTGAVSLVGEELRYLSVAVGNVAVGRDSTAGVVTSTITFTALLSSDTANEVLKALAIVVDADFTYAQDRQDRSVEVTWETSRNDGADGLGDGTATGRVSRTDTFTLTGDDLPLVFIPGDNGLGRAPVSEDSLQAATFAEGAVRVIPAASTISLNEGGDLTPDGVAVITIGVQLKDAEGSIIDGNVSNAAGRRLSPLDRPVADNEIITVGGVQYRIGFLFASLRESSGIMDAVVVGDTAATHEQALAFLKSLRFKLTGDDDDLVDTDARFFIALVPPTGPGIDSTVELATYYIPILATNDIEYTVAATETTITETEGALLSADSPHTLLVLTGYNVVETGDTAAPPQIFGVTSVNEGSSGGQLFASDDAGISASCDAGTGDCVVSFGESPIANRWGTLTFNVMVADSGGRETIVDADGSTTIFTLRVTPVNDLPEFSPPDVAPLADLEEDGSALKVILEGTNGPEESGTPTFSIEARTGVFSLTGAGGAPGAARPNLASISGNELTIDPSQVENACGEGTLTISARESGINGAPAPFSGGALGAQGRVASIAIACTNDPMEITLDPAENIDVPVGGRTTLAFTLSDPDWVNGRYIGRADEIIARGGILTVKLQEGSGDPSALAAAGVNIDFVESTDVAVSTTPSVVDPLPASDPFGQLHGKFNISVSGTRVGSVTRQRVSDVQTFEGDDSDTAVLNRTHFLKIEIDETDVRRGLFEKLINLIEVSSHDYDPYPEVRGRTIVVEFEEADNDRARDLTGSADAEVVHTARLPQMINMLGDPPASLSVSRNPDDGDFTESNLQTQMSGVSIVHPSTAIHQIVDINPPGITDDRFRQFIIEMVFENGGVPQSLTDNLLIKESRVVDFVPLEPSGQQVSIGRGSEERSLGANVRDGRLEFDADPSGGIDASWFKTLLTERLRFKLADGQNDPGETVRFIFTATPAERSPNQTPAETSVTYTITPQNDPPTGVAQDIPAVDEVLPGADAYRTTIISNLSPVESDQSVLGRISYFGGATQVGNPGINNATAELFSVNPAVSLSGGDSVELVYAPRAYRHGTLTFSVQVGDSDGATADFGPFTITINPVDNEPEITALAVVPYDEGAARLIELSDISNGPDEQPVSADHPVVMSASIRGVLVQPGVEVQVNSQNLLDSAASVTQDTVSVAITGHNGPDLLPRINGATTITFTATDGTADSGIAGGDTGLTATREVLAIINPVNDAPVLAQAPGAPFSVAPGEATTLKATITDPDIRARLAGFSPGSSELGYRAGSALTVALDEGSRNAEVDSEAVNIRLVDFLQAGESFDVDSVVVDGTVVNGVSLTVFRFVSADDLTIRVSRTGVGLIGQIRVTRSTPLAVTTGDNRQILMAEVTSNMRREAMNAFLQAAIMISIDGTDTSIRQDRVVEISFWDQGNDGEGGNAGPPKPSNKLAFALTSDPAPVITFGAAVTLTEDELKQPQVIFANTTITDVNEGTSLDPGTASGGFHGAAIASIQVVASAGANGALPNPTWVTDALPSGFSAAPNGLAVALTPTGASTLTSTGGAQAALRALSFRIADDNQDPPDQITFEVTLTPVQDVAGINPTNAVGTYTVNVTDINDPPTVELVTDTVRQDEDDPDGLADTVITIGSANAIETGQALQQGAATTVAASLTSAPNNVDGGFESLFTTLPSVNVSRTQIQVTHGRPAPDKYGTVEYTFVIRDSGGGFSSQQSFSYEVVAVPDPIVVSESSSATGTEGQAFQSASYTVADGPGEIDDIRVKVTGLSLWRYGDVRRFVSGADAFRQLEGLQISVDGVSHSLTGLDQEFTVSSSAVLTFQGRPKTGFAEFNGGGALTVELQDESGADVVQQASPTSLSFSLSIAAEDDPLELDLPGFLMVNAGTAETFIRGVSDPDVDPIALVGVGGGELAGNNAHYLRAGDTLIVKISAPGNASEADKRAVAGENSVGVADNTDGVSLVGEELSHSGAAVGNVAVARDSTAGVVTSTITFTALLSSDTANEVLKALAIVVDADFTYAQDRQDRSVEVTWETSRNDGADGLGDGTATGRVSRTDTFTLTGDDLPLVFIPGDNGLGRAPVSEDSLQAATFAEGAVRVIPAASTISLNEGGDLTPDGVLDILIAVELTDASGSFIGVNVSNAAARRLSPLDKPVIQGETVTVEGVQYRIGFAASSEGSGRMQATIISQSVATHAQTLAFLRALRFKLTGDDDDLLVGITNAKFTISLLPRPGSGINQAAGEATLFIPILATNDIEYTVAATATSIVEDASLSADEPSTLLVLTDYSVVESGDTAVQIAFAPIVPNGNINEGSSGGRLFASADAGISASCDEATGNCVVSFGESPIANRWGTLRFSVEVTDSGGREVVVDADGDPRIFTMRVRPVNDLPEFSPPDVTPLADLEEDGSALKVTLEGTNGPEESGTPTFSIKARTGVFGLTRPNLASISGNELTIDPSQVGNACGEGTLTISAQESEVNGDPAPFNSGGALGTSERVARIAIACTNDPMAITLDPAEDIDVPVGGSTTLAFALSDPDWVNGRYIGRADEIIARGGILTVKLQEGGGDPSALAAAGVHIDFVESDDLTVEAADTAPDLASDDPFGHLHGKFDISVSGTRVGSVTRQRVSDVQTFRVLNEGVSSTDDDDFLNRTHFLKIEIDNADTSRRLFEKLINLIRVSVHRHDPYPEVRGRTIVVEFEEADNDRARDLTGSADAEVVHTARLPQMINMLGDLPAFLRVSPNSDGDFSESNLQTQSSGVAIVGGVEIGDRNPPGIADDRFTSFTIEMVFENDGVLQSLTDNLLVKRNEEAGFVPLVSETSVSVGGFSDRRNYNGRIISGRLEFDTGVFGEDASWFKTLLTERLRFKLADDQDDPGATVRFDFTATPPAGASVNLTSAETSVTYTITPQNDPPTGVVQEIPAVDEVLPGADAYRTTIISNLSPVERGQSVLGRISYIRGATQVGNPGINDEVEELISSRDPLTPDGPLDIIFDLVDGDIGVTYAPKPYRHGTHTFSVRVGDSGGGGAATVFGPFTVTINPVDNEPEITAPTRRVFFEDSAIRRQVRLSDISNGPDEQPVSADHPVVMSASISGFLDQDGVEVQVNSQNLLDSAASVTQDTVSVAITGHNGPDLLPRINGAATITFTATDGTADSGIAGGDTGLTATREVGVTIKPVNDAPVLAQAPGAPFSVAPGEATTLKATITDPDIRARLAGFSPGSSELGYRAGSSLTVALDEGSRNAEVDSKAVNIRLVDALQADGGRLEVGGVEFRVFRFVSADDLTIIAGSGSTGFGQIKVTRSTPPAVTTGDNRQILRADVVTSNLRQEAMNAFLQSAIMISIDDTDTSIRQDRVVEISFWDQGNDGEGGDAGPPKPSNQLAFALTSDPAPVITFGAAVTLTEDGLKQPQVIFANTTITDVNEDLDRARADARDGKHGAAILRIQVVASAGVNGTLDGSTWVTDALGGGFTVESAADALTVNLRAAEGFSPASTSEVQAALRTLSFRIADDNQDPPETITFEVTLRPVQGVAGINPTNVVGTYTVVVDDINDPPTVELDIDTVEQDEDDPDGLANTVIIIGSADAIETGQALQQGAAARVDASLASSPNNVDGGFESLFTTLPSVNVSRTQIQVTHGTPAPGKYGTVEYSFTVQDAGGGDSDTSEPFSFTYQVRPVADPLVVTVSARRAPDPEGTTQLLRSTASLTVADGPEENDDIRVKVTSFELRRNGDRGRSISGADAFAQLANFRMSVGVSGGSTREEALTGVDEDGFEVPSGATLRLLGDLKDGLENFNGIGELRVELMDVPGQDGIQGPGTERSFFLSIAARDDPLELELPEFLVVNAGTTETFIRGVSDPDVDPIALVGAGGGELAGNNAPYLRAGDTLIVKISAPADASATDKEAVARENSVGVVDNTDGVILVGEELRYLSVAVGNVAVGRDGSAGVVTSTITFTSSLSSDTANVVLKALAIVVDANAAYSQDRSVEVTWETSRNDGADGLGDRTATGRVSKTDGFTMTGDEIPPTLPSDTSVKVETAVTTATLLWVPAQDRVAQGGEIVPAEDGSPYGGLRYTVVIREEGSTRPQTVTFDEAPYAGGEYRTHDDGTGGGAGYVLIKEGEGEGRRAEFQITRANAVLIPGRTYEFQLTATDRAGNPQDGALKYDPVSEKMKTGVVDDNDNGIHDELDAVIAAGGGLERYCGGDEFAVGSDGVPNRVEVRIGTDCRDVAPYMTDDSIPGSPRFGEIGMRTVAGTGPITRVELMAPECTNCGTLTAYSAVQYDEDDSGCTDRSGRAGVPGSDNPCQAADKDGDGYVLLGSFTRNILWVAENEFGWASAVEEIYVAPPVGFDLSMQTAAAGLTNVSLPVSVAVSDDVLNSEFMFSVELRAGGEQPIQLDQDNTNGVVEATLSSPLTTQEVTLAIIPASFTHNFVLANKTVEVKVFERPASEVVFGFGDRGLPLYVRRDGNFLPLGSNDLIPLTFTVNAPSEVSGGSFMVDIRRHRWDEPSSSVSVSSKSVMDGSTVDLSDEIEISDTAIEVGDTIEVRASTTADSFVEGRFIVVVVDAKLDANGNGVPDSREGDAGAGERRLPVYGARMNSVISERREFVEVSGSESDLTLALGGYAYALADDSEEQGFGNQGTRYSVVLHNPVPGIRPLEGLDVTDVATGVFDFSVKVSPGRVVVVLIPLLREATQPSPVYKFMEGEWDEFAVVNADRVYSAPVPCPSSNARRQPDGGAFDPGQHAWRSANDGVREGDRCLLMQIQDGGANDADGTANGVIHDPNALAVGLPLLEPVIRPMMGTVSSRSSAEVTVSTRPEIMDSDRRVRITLTLELEPTTATVSVKFKDPDGSSEDRNNVGDGGEFTVELTSGRKTQGLILETALEDPVKFSFAAAPSCEGCGVVGPVGRRGGGGGAMDPIWLIPLALGLLLPHVQRRRRRTSPARH